MLSEIGLDFEPVFTSRPEETRRLALEACARGTEALAVYGGDGTLSTVASAVCTLPAPPILGQIPAGSGNDWIRSLGIPQNPLKAAEVILSGATRLVDTGCCRIGERDFFFINSAGIGFDALVLRRTLSLRKSVPLRKSGYIISLAFSALIPPTWRATVSGDGPPFISGSYFTLTIGVGRFSGGGMSLAPEAVIDDGLLDAVGILPMGLPAIAVNLPRVFNGTLMKLGKARMERARRISVIPEGEVLLELDGEFVQFGSKPEKLVFASGPKLSVTAPRI